MSNSKKHVQLNLLLGDYARLSKYLDDPEVTGVAINPNGLCWLKPMGRPWEATEEYFDDAETRRMILSAASYAGALVSADHPILEGVLPQWDARIEAVVPPLSTGCSLTIRKPAGRVITLEDYVESGRLSQSHYDAIIEAIRDKRNIIVGGGTGSGKTTFINALIHALTMIAPSDRLFICEDTRELQCAAQNFTSFVFPAEGSEVALRVALRYEPDRIIFGELRHGATTLAALQAFNSGHPGSFTTVHCNSAYGVLLRMRNLIAQVTPGQVDLSLIAEACNYCVYLQKTVAPSPRVMGLIKVSPELRDGAFDYITL